MIEPPPYPSPDFPEMRECERLRKLEESYNIEDVIAFLEWASGVKGWNLCYLDFALRRNVLAVGYDEMFADYLGVDIERVNEERAAALAWYKKQEVIE